MGGQGFIAETRTIGVEGSEFAAPGLELVDATVGQSATESSLSKVNAGLFVQEQIGLDDAVFVTVGGRWDRNSAFGESTGSAFYPKAGVSFIPSDLAFWDAYGGLSTLRLRAAVGQSGLQPGTFDKLTTFQPAPTAEGPGVRPAWPLDQ